MTQANQERDFSSWHLLFTKPEHAALFASNKDLVQRISCQFHWFNRGYKDMEDYLSHFSSRKRKTARKEREKVAKEGITLTRTIGRDLTPADIDFSICAINPLTPNADNRVISPANSSAN